MDVIAKAKYVKMPASKVRDLAERMRGLSVSEALKVTDFSERKGAFHLGKVLKSAIANAEKNAKLTAADLKVKDAIVDEGPAIKRFWPRPRGTVSPILRRTCHIKIILTDGKS
ncbi:MAG: 50S ribosomal protein L22 [Kiritimatiellae bacterium]|nr:50S ribosomal protein L22 [Kiritimatiellia bacterium]MDD5522233.1 50S ribosomal protein L22 [Kiritimatiellia bacterium]